MNFEARLRVSRVTKFTTEEATMRTDVTIIELAVDVSNPTPDRRSKDWNKLPVVPKGSRFIVTEHTIRSSVGGYAWERDSSELGKAIIARAIKATPTSVRELMIVYDCDFDSSEVLRMLIKLGKITPNDFEAVAKAANEDERF